MANRNDINTRYSNFRDCCDSAPDGTYEAAKELKCIIQEHMDALLADVREAFPTIRPDNCDGIHNVEATIYTWLADAEGSLGQFATAEGFGCSLGYGPETAARVIAQAARDRDALARIQGRG
jgi:hypothetical protein